MVLLRTLLLALAFAASANGLAVAQALPTLPSMAPNASFDIQQEGVYTTAPIVLDGAILFRVAVASGASASIAERVTIVEGVLQEIISEVQVGGASETSYDPATFAVKIVHEGDSAVLEATDGRHHQPVPIVTVTTTDAEYNLTTVDVLAATWQQVLQNAIVASLLQRQPAQERLNVERVLIAAGVLVVLTLIFGLLVATLRRRIGALHESLEKRQDAADGAAAASDGDDAEQVQHRRRRLLAFALRRTAPEQRLRIYGALADLLIWALILLWFLGLTWGLGRFPQTTATSRELWHGALGVAGIWIVAAVVNRALDIAIQRAAAAWHVRYHANAEDRARDLLRIPTVANALAGFKTFLIVFIAGLASLSQVGFAIGSVITIGGIAALGISLAAQNFVRDFVNGFLVLLEDQYVVGDYVTINTVSGLVETLTLRISQIRDATGTLVTIPHSSVTMVANHSRSWSRVDFVVSVDPAADPDAAIAAVRGAIDTLANDAEWRDAVHGPVEWIGIDSVTKDWMAIRAAVRTAPLRQFAVRRELNARVVHAFHEAKLGFGVAIAGEDYYHP
jgi:small conductance mechanosensitive channel